MEKLSQDHLDFYNEYCNTILNNNYINILIKNLHKLINFNFNIIPIIQFNSNNLFSIKLINYPKNIFTDHYENEEFYDKKIGYFIYSFIINLYQNNLHNLTGGILRNFFDPQIINNTKYIDIDMIGFNYYMLQLINKIKKYNINDINNSYNYDIKIKILHEIIFGTKIKINELGIYRTINSINNITINYTILDKYILKLDINNIISISDSYTLRTNLCSNSFYNNTNILKPFTNIKNSDFLQNELQLCKDPNTLKLFLYQPYNPKLDVNNQLNRFSDLLIIKKICNYKIKNKDNLIKIIIDFLGESELYKYKLYYSIVKKIMMFSHKMCSNKIWNTQITYIYYKILDRYLKFYHREFKILSSKCICKNNKCIYEGLNAFIKHNKFGLFFISFPEFIEKYYINKLHIYNGSYQNIINHNYKLENNSSSKIEPSMICKIYLNSEISTQGNYKHKKNRNSKIILFESLIKREKKKSKIEYAKLLNNIKKK